MYIKPKNASRLVVCQYTAIILPITLQQTDKLQHGDFIIIYIYVYSYMYSHLSHAGYTFITLYLLIILKADALIIMLTWIWQFM